MKPVLQFLAVVIIGVPLLFTIGYDTDHRGRWVVAFLAAVALVQLGVVVMERR